jgi:thiosulfate dehydrogenase [quinone] large subunit
MGFLKGRIEDYSSPLAGLPARLYTGYFLLKYGLAKFTGGFGGTELHETLTKWASGPAYHFYVPFLETVAIPHAALFARLVTLGEIAVGALLLAGCATRLAALGGLFLCLNFAFASGAPVLSTEQPVVFALLLVTIYATAAGRALGLDALLKGRLPSWVA